MGDDRTRDVDVDDGSRSALDAALGGALLRALDSLPIGITVHRVGADGPRRIYGNQALADILGVSLAELRRAPAFVYLAPEERSRTEVLQRAWLEGAAPPQHLESALVAADGRHVPIEIRTSTTYLDGDRVLVVFISDITDRRRVEDALRASEALFRQVAEGAPDGITIIVDGRLAYANPATARLLGHDSTEALIGLPMDAFLDASEIGAMRDRIARMFAGEAIPPREYRGRRRDGTTALVEISSMPIEFRGRPAVLGIARDVGERRRRQAEVVRAERMAAVGALAAGVAHEINNPLTYVMLQLDRLRHALPRAVADPALQAQLLAMVADASDGSTRVAGIVRDLLWFSRDDEARGPADVAEVAETATKLAMSAVRHRAQLVKRFDSARPVAMAGPRLAQVVVNLLVNASQAFEDDDLGRNRIEITVGEADGRVVLEIADNGCGFPDDVLAHAFEPFYTTKVGGTGLGLAISRSIVEEAGGAISIQHRPGGGALVRLELLPWRGDAPAPRTAPASVAARGRVAIIDDEAPIARSLGEWLEIDHEVTIHLGAEEALTALATSPAYDCVICDLRMPGLSGLELLRRLVGTRPEYRGRFVFIGGAVSPDQVASARDLGAEVLHKPFDMSAVDRAVARRLARLG